MTSSKASFTQDSLFDGKLTCFQGRTGYRFSVDSLLVAHFCKPAATDKILDIGTGSGIINLILSHAHKDISCCGLEIQKDLYDLAQKNVLANKFSERIQLVNGDLRNISQFFDPESFDLVVSNPPYRKTGTGRINSQSQAARARHEIDCTISDVVKAAAFAVKNRKSVVFVYPAKRVSHLIATFHVHKLMPKRLQPIYSYPGAEEARLVMVEGVKNGGEEMKLLTPFYIYAEKNGPYSAEMQTIYNQ